MAEALDSWVSKWTEVMPPSDGQDCLPQFVLDRELGLPAARLTQDYLDCEARLRGLFSWCAPPWGFRLWAMSAVLDNAMAVRPDLEWFVQAKSNMAIADMTHLDALCVRLQTLLPEVTKRVDRLSALVSAPPRAVNSRHPWADELLPGLGPLRTLITHGDDLTHTWAARYSERVPSPVGVVAAEWWPTEQPYRLWPLSAYRFIDGSELDEHGHRVHQDV